MLQGEFRYKGRHVTFQEERGRILLKIDGIPAERISRLRDQYFTHFLPHRGYPSVEELAKALVDTEGQLWILRREGAGHPHS